MATESETRGKGHPLPASGEARYDEIPEHAVRDKGRGDDSGEVIQPPGDAVAPDGERYRYEAAGADDDDIRRDQAAHQDRGQSAAEDESDPD